MHIVFGGQIINVITTVGSHIAIEKSFNSTKNDFFTVCSVFQGVCCPSQRGARLIKTLTLSLR